MVAGRTLHPGLLLSLPRIYAGLGESGAYPKGPYRGLLWSRGT